MKFTLFTISTLFIFASCKKDDVQPLPDSPENVPPLAYLIMGDSLSSNVQFVNYSPNIVLENSTNDVLTHQIDMDSDGTNDVELSLHSYFAFANTWYKGTQVKVKALHSNAEISKDAAYTDSVYFFAQRYFENDSLAQSSLWAS